MKDWKYFWHVSAIFCAMWVCRQFVKLSPKSFFVMFAVPLGFFFTVSISRSLWIATFFTYQGASSISLSVFDWNLWIMSTGLSCRLLPTAVFHRCRLALWLLCRWSAYCKEIVGISCQQANTFYVVLESSLFFLL